MPFRNRWARTWLAATLVTICLPGASSAQNAPQREATPADSATIVLHLLERPVGTERFRIETAAGGCQLNSSQELTDRGGRITHSATLDVAPDFTPTHFRASGRTYRFVNVDVEFTRRGRRATLRNGNQSSSVALSGPFFPARSYAPLSGRALLVRYWERQGRPAKIRLLPGDATSTIEIQATGTDTVRAAGRSAVLRRYTVNGVVWGRETLWLDSTGRFAAIVTRIHILPLEGVRSDLTYALLQLQASAVRDAMREAGRQAADMPSLHAGDYAITNIRLFDGTDRPVVENAVLFVRGGHVAAAGAAERTRVPAGVPMIDGGGATVIPGLWDMHGHVSQIEWGPAYLAAGVTTVRDMGGEARFLTAFRDSTRAGHTLAPRLLLAGLIDGSDSLGFGAVTAGTPAEARNIVARYRAMGFRQVKLYSRLQPEVVRAIIDAAHGQGMTVTGHLPASMSLEQWVAAGADQVAHMPLGDDSAESMRNVRLLARHATVVDPTIPWDELLGRAPEIPIESFEPGIRNAPATLALSYRSVRTPIDSAAYRARLNAELRTVKLLHDAGVKFTAGTDGALPGYSVIREIELFVQAGLSPADAIRAATVMAARASGLDGESGSLEAGKRADFVVLDADPLANIANLRRVRWVSTEGRVYLADPLWRAAGFTPGGGSGGNGRRAP
jgi:imidazolonepropionase-like amidohydrolase